MVAAFAPAGLPTPIPIASSLPGLEVTDRSMRNSARYPSSTTGQVSRRIPRIPSSQRGVRTRRGQGRVVLVPEPRQTKSRAAAEEMARSMRNRKAKPMRNRAVMPDLSRSIGQIR